MSFDQHGRSEGTSDDVGRVAEVRMGPQASLVEVPFLQFDEGVFCAVPLGIADCDNSPLDDMIFQDVPPPPCTWSKMGRQGLGHRAADSL